MRVGAHCGIGVLQPHAVDAFRAFGAGFVAAGLLLCVCRAFVPVCPQLVRSLPDRFVGPVRKVRCCPLFPFTYDCYPAVWRVTVAVVVDVSLVRLRDRLR